MAVSLARQFDSSVCTLTEYGSDGSGVLSSGSVGGCGQAVLCGGEVAAQPVSSQAQAVAVSSHAGGPHRCGLLRRVFDVLEADGFGMGCLHGPVLGLCVLCLQGCEFGGVGVGLPRPRTSGGGNGNGAARNQSDWRDDHF